MYSDSLPHFGGLNDCLMTPQHKSKSAIGCLFSSLFYFFLKECNHFAEKRKYVFGKRNVVESFIFHHTHFILFKTVLVL